MTIQVSIQGDQGGHLHANKFTKFGDLKMFMEKIAILKMVMEN